MITHVNSLYYLYYMFIQFIFLVIIHVLLTFLCNQKHVLLGIIFQFVIIYVCHGVNCKGVDINKIKWIPFNYKYICVLFL